jgi:D-sedoheptulose 7-phosphate isomerase
MSVLTLDRVASMMSDSLALKAQLLADTALHEQILVVMGVCVDALARGNKIMLAGNGGSAAAAQHIATEFIGRFAFHRPGLPCIALTTDTAVLTAIGNDYGFEQLFARQLEALGREGDVFIALSTSGNSRNVMAAVEAAQHRGMITVGMCGAAGALKNQCRYALCVPSLDTPRIQEGHLLIGHILCALCEEALFAEHRPQA